MKKNIVTLIISVFAGFGGSYLYNNYFQEPEKVLYTYRQDSIQSVNTAENKTSSIRAFPDFQEASSLSTESVVYIKTKKGHEASNWMEWYFYGGTRQSAGSGSGVIFSQDGYIITNNHVIKDADIIEVKHKKRSYEAKIIGIDESTDLAVLKIDADDLPAIKFGNSSKLGIGEWVLAVGNPFNLTSTVTAGIVSAKGRDINIVKSRFPIESFIQTDAAINPGNSGGALVNTEGELVGINTAILSETGSYTGYGFAVPSDIVYKVVSDLVQFGEVQKAIFGAEVLNMSDEIVDELQTANLDGVIIESLYKKSAAAKANLQPGDVLLSVNGEKIQSKSHFDELLSYYRPGKEIQITYLREGKTSTSSVKLQNIYGSYDLIERRVIASSKLDAVFEELSKPEKDKLDIDHGIRLIKPGNGLMARLGIREGFIIQDINGTTIETVDDLEKNLLNTRGKVIVNGITESGVKGYYSFYF